MVTDTGSPCTLVHRTFISNECISGTMHVTFGAAVSRCYPEAQVRLHGDVDSVIFR